MFSSSKSSDGRQKGSASVFAGLLVSPLAFASDQEASVEEMYAITEVTCKEVMILGGDDRDEVISFLHGYLAGEARKSVIDIVKLGLTTDKFLDKCLDSPNEKALNTLRSFVGQ